MQANDSRPRILVAVHAPALRRLLRVALTLDDFDVLLAADGGEAKAVFETVQLAGIVVDVDLPRLGGVEFLRFVRATSPVPVILLGVPIDSEPRLGGDGLRATAFIRQPFDPEALSHRLRQVLGT